MSFLRSLLDFLEAIFSHERSPHCPCVNCRIMELEDQYRSNVKNGD